MFYDMNRADDLIPEESDTVLLALKRLPPKEAYDRVYRLRRAFQVRGQTTRIRSMVREQKLTSDSALLPINYYPKTNRLSLKMYAAM